MSDRPSTATPPSRSEPVAVIGAGFSGTMAAIQLLAHLPPDRPVLLCERAERFGRGRAYATDNPDHLLNVRAANMSADPERPADFEDWLARSLPADAAGIRRTPAGTFAARGLYGRYLSELLAGAVAEGTVPRLRLVNDAIVEITPANDRLLLRSEGGLTYTAAGAVLAMGNLAAPTEPASRFRADPWHLDGFGRLHAHLPVLIVGTGLTMVDAVLTLRRRGFTGGIVALSRHGLLPAQHAAVRPRPCPDLQAAETASLIRLFARIRREAALAGAEWHGVIDALRPVTDRLWLGLSQGDRARFLRHLRPYWDVHRHRTAPPAGATIAAEIAAGTLQVRAGRILGISDAPDRASVTVRPRGGRNPETLEVQCILDARGIGRVADTLDPLLRGLIARGLVRPGPFGIGLDARPDLSVIGAETAPPLWTLGPLLRGVFWECTAVPDIRNQAADLARAVAARLDPTITPPRGSP